MIIYKIKITLFKKYDDFTCEMYVYTLCTDGIFIIFWGAFLSFQYDPLIHIALIICIALCHFVYSTKRHKAIQMSLQCNSKKI